MMPPDGDAAVVHHAALDLGPNATARTPEGATTTFAMTRVSFTITPASPITSASARRSAPAPLERPMTRS